MPEDLDRSARDDLDDPVFPYPHLNATLTSWESFLDVVAASEDEIVEDARKIMQQMLSTRIKSVSHGVLLLGGFCGTWAIVFAGARSDIFTSFRRKRVCGSTSATNFTGTRSASHTRFGW